MQSSTVNIVRCTQMLLIVSFKKLGQKGVVDQSASLHTAQ